LSGGGTEYDIRKKLIDNGLVEAILVLPRRMFYTTDISVSLWVLNKNKRERTVSRNDETIQYRDRKNEVLFMDLRQMGSPFEKKFTQLSKEDIGKVANTFHTWQSIKFENEYENSPEYCYSASFEELKKEGFFSCSK
jgi:type I restriction enzyme M protein